MDILGCPFNAILFFIPFVRHFFFFFFFGNCIIYGSFIWCFWTVSSHSSDYYFYWAVSRKIKKKKRSKFKFRWTVWKVCLFKYVYWRIENEYTWRRTRVAKSWWHVNDGILSLVRLYTLILIFKHVLLNLVKWPCKMSALLSEIKKLIVTSSSF